MEFKKNFAWNEEHQSILDNITSLADMSDEVQVQKKKFTLLSELLLKLCTSRNVRSNFKDLTSLILLFLNMYKKNIKLLGAISYSKHRVNNEAKNERRNYQAYGKKVQIESIKINKANPRSNLKKFKKWRK